MILGLTGGYCAGKNAAAALLEARGWTAVDVDRLGHEALAAEAGAVAARFGPGVLAADGRVDRRALGAIVFASRKALADLEAIVHPRMFALLDERLASLGAAGGRACVNAAILYKMPVLARCDLVVEVRAGLAARIRRGRARDGLAPLAVLGRILRQRPLWERRPRGARAPLVLRNDDGAEELERGLDALLARAGLI